MTSEDDLPYQPVPRDRNAERARYKKNFDSRGPLKQLKVEFRKQWGGEDNWYTKSKRWANKQIFPINHLSLGLIEWLWGYWVEAKVKMTMDDVDNQAEAIVDLWEEEDAQPKPEIIITPSEVEGLDTIEIKSPWQRK